MERIILFSKQTRQEMKTRPTGRGTNIYVPRPFVDPFRAIATAWMKATPSQRIVIENMVLAIATEIEPSLDLDQAA